MFGGKKCVSRDLPSVLGEGVQTFRIFAQIGPESGGPWELLAQGCESSNNACTNAGSSRPS